MTDKRETSEKAARNSKTYSATKDELRALDEAKQSGIASAREIAAAFKTFRQKS
jgi:hypothetical protein